MRDRTDHFNHVCIYPIKKVIYTHFSAIQENEFEMANWGASKVEKSCLFHRR